MVRQINNFVFTRIGEELPKYSERVLLCVRHKDRARVPTKAVIGWRTRTDLSGEHYDFEGPVPDLFEVYAWAPIPVPGEI